MWGRTLEKLLIDAIAWKLRWFKPEERKRFTFLSKMLHAVCLMSDAIVNFFWF